MAWNENEHPRDEEGKFTEKENSNQPKYIEIKKHQLFGGDATYYEASNDKNTGYDRKYFSTPKEAEEYYEKMQKWEEKFGEKIKDKDFKIKENAGKIIAFKTEDGIEHCFSFNEGDGEIKEYYRYSYESLTGNKKLPTDNFSSLEELKKATEEKDESIKKIREYRKKPTLEVLDKYYNKILSDDPLYDNESKEQSEGGYKGYSMSNRAVQAYENGQMPKSKWGKDDIINKIEEDGDLSPIVEELKKLPLKKLQEITLEESSWHHTGAFMNATNFYGVRSPLKIYEAYKMYKLFGD